MHSDLQVANLAGIPDEDHYIPRYENYPTDTVRFSFLRRSHIKTFLNDYRSVILRLLILTALSRPEEPHNSSLTPAAELDFPSSQRESPPSLNSQAIESPPMALPFVIVTLSIGIVPIC